MGSIPTRDNEIFNISIFLLWSRGKELERNGTQRRALSSATQLPMPPEFSGKQSVLILGSRYISCYVRDLA